MSHKDPRHNKKQKEKEQEAGKPAKLGRKVWKLSPMDLKSYDLWDDYTRARDEMFLATDIPWAPWYVAKAEDKKRLRLNLISHLLAHIPYEELPQNKVSLGKRKTGKYQAVDYQFKYIAEPY